jgi:excisionase family DNA binding protein
MQGDALRALNPPVTDADAREITAIYENLLQRHPKLVGPDGTARLLPVSLYTFLCQLLADINEGRSVTILQEGAQLTTVEGAKLLGVSRQFFVSLLESGQIPYFMVGTHRRVYARDLLAFKARRDAARRAALDKLSRDETEAGTYDLITRYDSEP